MVKWADKFGRYEKMFVYKENDDFIHVKDDGFYMGKIINKKTNEVLTARISDTSGARLNTIWKVSHALRFEPDNVWLSLGLKKDIKINVGTYHVCKMGSVVEFSKWDDAVDFVKAINVNDLSGTSKRFYLR